MPCPNIDQNQKNCNCTSTSCSRHGVCCECIKYHRKQGGKPMCLK